MLLVDRLRELRKKKRLTQTEIANSIGLSHQAYSHYENGRSIPPFPVAIKIAEILDVSLDYLCGRIDEPWCGYKKQKKRYKRTGIRVFARTGGIPFEAGQWGADRK